MDKRIQNFLDLYLEAIEENINEVDEVLKNAGIDPDESRERILKMIKQKKAELKRENAKKIGERVLKVFKGSSDKILPASSNDKLALSYRKLGKLDPDEEALIKNDVPLLDEIKKIISEEKDET